MLKGNERWIIHYDGHLAPVPNDGPIQIPLRDVLNHIKFKFSSGLAHATIDNVTLRIQQMQIGTAWTELLITTSTHAVQMLHMESLIPDLFGL